MALSDLIKGKSGQVATATPATIATQEEQLQQTVAKVATVTVANQQNTKIIAQTMTTLDDDDRRHCRDCTNLSHGGRCLAAERGELETASKHYRPLDDLPRRCNSYASKAHDPDQRRGRERWTIGAT